MIPLVAWGWLQTMAALAGGCGAVLRFVVDGALRARLRTSLPAGTMAINLVGSFVLGLVAGAVAHGRLTPSLLVVAGTGLCGGFTTFSTASLDVVRLLQQRRALVGTAWAIAMGACALVLAWLGLICG